MTGRSLAFSDPEVIATLRSRFVTVTGDDWYKRRQQDAVGAFFRSVSDQGPRKGKDGHTRQGLYAFTASGKLLVFGNNATAARVKSMLRKALEAWSALPPEERAPRAFTEKAGKPDHRYHRELPEGGVALRVHARELVARDGSWTAAPARRGSRGTASLDHVWFTETEWRSLRPGSTKPGSSSPVPAALARRLARFHLIDNTRGEPPMWRPDELRKIEMTLTVTATPGATVELALAGAALLKTERGDRGYEATLSGRLSFDEKTGTLTRFDAVAIGDHWGEGRYTPNARPGRAPLGVCFQLADGSRAADRVPPQGARNQRAYFGKER